MLQPEICEQDSWLLRQPMVALPEAAFLEAYGVRRGASRFSWKLHCKKDSGHCSLSYSTCSGQRCKLKIVQCTPADCKGRKTKLQPANQSWTVQPLDLQLGRLRGSLKPLRMRWTKGKHSPTTREYSHESQWKSDARTARNGAQKDHLEELPPHAAQDTRRRNRKESMRHTTLAVPVSRRSSFPPLLARPTGRPTVDCRSPDRGRTVQFQFRLW